MPELKVAQDAEERGQGICRTCLAPIWNEGGTIGHRKVDTGWSDRVERGGDSLVCFKANRYRHVPLTGREAYIYDVALTRASGDAATVEKVAAAMWWQEFGYDRGITWEQRVQQELDHRRDPSWSGPVARYRRLASAALSALSSADLSSGGVSS